MIKVFTIFTENHRPQFEQFSKSLPENFHVYGKFVELPGGSFGNTAFFRAVYERLDFLKKAVRRNFGRNIMWLDTDIVVARDFENVLNEMLNLTDMVFQDNGNDYNVGVWGIKCSQVTYEFLSELASHPPEFYDNSKGGVFEQSYISSRLKSDDWKNRLACGILPTEFYDSHHDYSGWMNQIPSNCFLFHATNCKLDAKMGRTGEFIGKIALPELNARLARSIDSIKNYYPEVDMAIKTKLRIVSILPIMTPTTHLGGIAFDEARRVRFTPSVPADTTLEKFRKDIPEAAVEMTITDPALWPELEIDKDYWFDITKV